MQYKCRVTKVFSIFEIATKIEDAKFTHQGFVTEKRGKITADYNLV